MPVQFRAFSSRQPTVMFGIMLKTASVAALVSMSSLLKASEGVPAGELVFFRSFFSIPPILIVLAMQGELARAFVTQNLPGHLWRSIVGVSSMTLGFYALTQLPLTEAIGITYTAPLIMVVLSALWLKETVRAYRWTAVVVGFVGVGIVLYPRLTLPFGGDADIGLALGALAGLGAACLTALAQIAISTLVRSERTSTIVLYFAVISSVLSLLTIPFGWVWPSPAQWAMLIGAGFVGGIGQILLTESYRHADVSVVAPFEYTSLILGLIIGYFAFGDIPTVTMLAGGALLIGSGLFIIWRERQLARPQVRVPRPDQ